MELLLLVIFFDLDYSKTKLVLNGIPWIPSWKRAELMRRRGVSAAMYEHISPSCAGNTVKLRTDWAQESPKFGRFSELMTHNDGGRQFRVREALRALRGFTDKEGFRVVGWLILPETDDKITCDHRDDYTCEMMRSILAPITIREPSLHTLLVLSNVDKEFVPVRNLICTTPPYKRVLVAVQEQRQHLDLILTRSTCRYPYWNVTFGIVWLDSDYNINNTLRDSCKMQTWRID
ncbi:hypothetical protein J6590_032888 [Homalodisca vitripennis]|nr:hypothetical protein J6590_032888 [Homalodisca vitripennis]